MRQCYTQKLGITLLLINASINIAFSLYTPYTTAYYTKSGLNALQIGILLTIGPLVAIVIQPIWAILSDRTGRRKDILSLVVLGSALSMLSFYIGHTFWTFFIAATLVAVFTYSIVPLNDAITLRCASKYQLDFSRIRMGGTVGFAIVVVISGAIIKQHPSWQFAMGFLGYLLLLFFVRKHQKDEKEETSVTLADLPAETQVNSKKGLLHIFESKQVYFMLAFAFISQTGLSFHGGFIGVYMTKLGFTEGTIGVVNSICALSELPVLFFINKALRKFSSSKIIIFSSLLLGIRILLVTGGNLGFIIASQVLNGLTYMTIYFCCAVYISNNVKKENQSKGQSVLTIIQAGLGSIVGNIVGGYLVDHFGLKMAYLYMSILIITVSLLIAILQYIYQRTENKKALA